MRPGVRAAADPAPAPRYPSAGEERAGPVSVPVPGAALGRYAASRAWRRRVPGRRHRARHEVRPGGARPGTSRFLSSYSRCSLGST